MGRRKGKRSRQRGSASLTFVKRRSAEYNKIASLFWAGWRHPISQKAPATSVQYILRVRPNQYWLQLFRRYRAKIKRRRRRTQGNVRMLWHGTRGGLCNLLRTSLRQCLRTCPLCNILNSTLKQSSGGMFGAGIYVTSASSKADDYTGNLIGNVHVPQAGRRAITLFKVVVGRTSIAKGPMNNLNRAPKGFDSLLGTPPRTQGLNFDEVVVYRRRATIPAYVVVYR